MFWLPIILLAISLGFVEFKLSKNILRYFACLGISIALTIGTVMIDYQIQTTDVEVWSGRVVDWSHDEEWEEWHPPVCTTDDKGNQSCTAGYWEHHYAENHVKTTDDGWIYVKNAPDGTVFDDSYPNDVTPLLTYFPKDTPTASSHTYTNKVQASYSIYRHKDIDISEFPDLPEYPSQVHDYFYIDRILGFVPNKEMAVTKLDEHNSNLNKMIPDPERQGKMRSWKQVNIVFVNVGENKPESYGFALQDKWQNGNKNDFVIAFSMNSDGKLNWVYPFSWSEVEILKLEVRDLMMEDIGQIKDFVPVVDKVAELVEKKFERKKFADFDYLHIETSIVAIWIVWILNITVGSIATFLSYKEHTARKFWGKYYRRYY